MMLAAAILAGGLAKRLRPISESLPKSLVEVAGRPFLFHQLDWLRGEGVERVVLCAGYLGEQIRAIVGDGSGFGLEVDYSFDGDYLLGTGGALRKAAPMLGEAFFVLYGDSYLSCPLAEVERAFRLSEKPALMTVLRNDGRWDRSNAMLRDDGMVRYNKRIPSPEMCYIDYGLSVLSASVLEQYGSGEVFDLADALSAISAQGELAGFEVTERFYEIGSIQGLGETEAFLLGKRK